MQRKTKMEIMRSTIVVGCVKTCFLGQFWDVTKWQLSIGKFNQI
jgi:hypothetical protein